MNTETKKVKNNNDEIEKQLCSLTLSEIYKIVVGIIKKSGASKYYLESFVYKIFCKHALFFNDKNYKNIAKVGGFNGVSYKQSVLRACTLHDKFSINHQEFREISKECFDAIQYSNKVKTIADISNMKKEVISNITNKIMFFSDEDIKNLILNISNGN